MNTTLTKKSLQPSEMKMKKIINTNYSFETDHTVESTPEYPGPIGHILHRILTTILFKNLLQRGCFVLLVRHKNQDGAALEI